MKNKVFIPFLFAGLLISGIISAQDEKFGDDPETCRVKLSTYTEFFNQKNYKDAMSSWRWCFLNCPEATRNIYIHGTTIIEYFISNQTEVEDQQAYIDTLMMVFDNRIKYFDQKGLVLGRKGVSMVKYRPDGIKEAYDVFKESFEIGGNSTEYFVLGFYMNTAVLLMNQEVITKEEVVEIYSVLSDAIKYQVDNETNEGRKEKIVETAQSIENDFVNSGAADCPAVINLFGPQFDANPDDLELARKIIGLLDRGKGDECKLADLYMKAAVLVYQNEKNARSAHSIAQSYFKRGDNDNAEKFYNEAINLEEDPIKKADMYYELALLYYGNFNNYPKARQAARSCIASNPNHGKAYLLIGRCYAAGGGSCGETAFEKKSLNWLIVDQFVKARSVDPELSPEANELIGRYSARFPTQEEGFWINITEGQTVTIGCWINESTTVRFLK